MLAGALVGRGRPRQQRPSQPVSLTRSISVGSSECVKWRMSAVLRQTIETEHP